jgi:poly(3-hydroxybutyrate) depolymerase
MNISKTFQILTACGISWSGTLVAFAAEPNHLSFTYTQATHSVTVWYDVPAKADANSPVVFVLPGIKRNGEDYLKDWTPLAEAHPFILVVPEFSEAQFPTDTSYILGNTVDASGHAVPREQWSFSFIEPIFDAIRTRTGNHSTGYLLYGHSAGAQFVQRFVYFVPQARLTRAVTANAGWYMMPDLTIDFPYGLRGTPVTAADLRHALALPLTVLLGTADTNAKDKVLRHTPEAEAQGPDRYSRGKYFFAHSTTDAHRLGAPLGWRLATAPDIGHSDEGMAPFAVKALFSVPTAP